MNSSFLYHVFGLYDHYIHTGTQYKGTTIILNIKRRDRENHCPHCKNSHIVKNGSRKREITGLPIGLKKTLIRLKVQRYLCRECGHGWYEDVPFVKGQHSCCLRFEKLAVDLLKFMPISAVSEYLQVGWDTIKDIHCRYLKSRYSPPKIKGVTKIGIDEFAVRKGHVYKTIVVDLDTGSIIYVADGRSADALDGFWKRVKRNNLRIEYVTTDLSAAYSKSIFENAPYAKHIYDHYHVVHLMNDALDEIRRLTFAMEKDVNKRNVIKGMRYLLLRNGEDIFDEKHKTRLANALAMNEPISMAYYLKEDLRQIWTQDTKEQAEMVLHNWVRQAKESKIPQLIRVANTIMAHRSGILAWYDCRLSNAMVEGINNKIKVLKRNAYGYRDDKYFHLRLYALHDCHITQNVG